jgi:HAD superfamily hydrolase (TIGR01509 family)
MPRSHDVLLFDLGGVLIHFAGFEELPKILTDAAASEGPAEIRERWIHSESVQAFERGEFGAGEFGERFVAEWRPTISADEFVKRFAAWPRGPYPGARELLSALRSSYRLACLSNANELHTHRHRAALGDLLDATYFSNEMGVGKPEAEIYRRVVGDLGVPPGRIAFFDDTAVNVEAARQEGLDAHLTDGLAALRGRLCDLGILEGEGRRGG